MTDLLNVEINGKYNVIQKSTGELMATRNGEEWRDLVGDDLVLAMAQRIDDLIEWQKKAFVVYPNIDRDIEKWG